MREPVRPGMKPLEIVEEIEMSAVAPIGENGLESGIVFPTGLNIIYINDCAARYILNPGDATACRERVTTRYRSLELVTALRQGNVLKVKVSIHVKGRSWTGPGFRVHFDIGSRR